MKDTHDKRRELAGESEKRSGKLSENRKELRPEQKEAERIRQRFADNPGRGDRSQENLRRLERIEERSSMRRLPDFDPRRELRRENFEIRENPEGFLRRHRGEGLDTATEREVSRALQERDRRKPRPEDHRSG